MAGGGSGGHVYPIKSLIQFLASEKEFSSRVQHVYRFGQRDKLEEKEFLSLNVKKSIVCSFVYILSWKLRREKGVHAILKNFHDIFLFILWFFQSLYFLTKYKVDVIFCKWGYVAAPVVLAWALLRKKIVAHESDTHPWLSSRVATPFAKKVFTWFSNVFSKAEVVGQILSDDIYFDPNKLKTKNKTLIKDNFIEKFSNILGEENNKKDKTIVLVLWWSLWSKDLYDTLESVLNDSPQMQEDVIFIVVGGFINKGISQKFTKFPNVLSFDYLSQKEMWMACYYADIGLTRGGTTSLAEQKLYNMKLLISPIPRTHDQYDNAQYYVDHYGDILIDQKHNFQETLKLHLEHFCWYKKEMLWLDKDDIKTKIQKAKRTILTELTTTI